MKQVNRPILINGERYITPHISRLGGPQKDKRPTFDETKARLIGDIRNAVNRAESVPECYNMDEIVLSLRMGIDYSAKSFHPTPLLNYFDAIEVGTKKWTKSVEKKGKSSVKIGKEVFFRVRLNNLRRLEDKLINDNKMNKNVIDSIRCYERVSYPDNCEILNKFDENWDSGRVEIVIHPYGDKTNNVKERLIELFNGDDEVLTSMRIRSYDSGITFISAILSKKSLENIVKFNPIRTVHPLKRSSIPFIRLIDSGLPLPQLPVNPYKSKIKLGIFDGGVNQENEYLKNFVNEHNPVTTEKDDSFISHGMAVAGAALFGNIAQYSSAKELPTPRINIESFRVFPQTSDNDIDLYETIDIIEDIVPKRPDIHVYNLSIGPYGAIDDDNISRFTYALDELSKNGDKLFVVAVGNDGDLHDDTLCRIQAPADAVNCIGVGSYVRNTEGEIERAFYSSYGDGREGCKIKPDVVAFGGDERMPFHLISLNSHSRYLSYGTSFSSPLVAAKAAEIIGRCPIADPLLARALLIHTARHPNIESDKYLGHGVILDNVDEMLDCTENSVTVIYQNKIRPASQVKIPLPIINNLEYNGKVTVEWTIALATPVDANHTEDYTLVSVEDTFYNHSNKYKLERYVDGKKKTKEVVISSMSERDKILSEGWRIPNSPKSCSKFDNKYKPEQDRRSNFKWDTIVNRRTTLNYKSMHEPFLVIHAMDRYGSALDHVNYTAVISIKYNTAAEDVYKLTIDTFNMLEVANIRNEVDILIRSDR